MSRNKKSVIPVYIRLGTVDIEEVLDFVTLEKDERQEGKKDFFGESVKLTSDRYKVYLVRGVKCVHCGIEGVFFALEKSIAQETKKYHFNLYAIDRHGYEIMMTVDHIIPKSKGGSDLLDNKQPLCINCNNKKGDKLSEEKVALVKTE